MSDVRYLSKKFIIEFIELYKTLPSLWNLKSKDYYDRTKKKVDYEIMVEKLREVEPDATREMVTQKINSLRSSRRKEVAKIKQSIEEGGEVYVPKLWYYKLLDFVDGQDSLTRVALSEREEKLSGNEFKRSPESQIDVDVWASNRDPSESNDTLSESNDAPVIAFTTHATPHKRQINKRQPDKRQSFKRQRKASEETREETNEAFGSYIARKLGTLSHNQRIFAEKLINDVIFEAELGNLNRDCYVYVPARKLETSDSE